MDIRLVQHVPKSAAQREAKETYECVRGTASAGSKEKKAMPQRSSGCALCRHRKVRCDLTRPGCKKCHVYGKVCPGYSTTAWRFHDQTKELAVRYGSSLEVGQRATGTASSRQQAPMQIGLPQAIASNKIVNLTILSGFQSMYSPYCRLSDTTWSFLEQLPPITDCIPPLRTTLQTLFTALIATDSQNPRLSVEAQILHNRSIIHVMQATVNPHIDTEQKIAATLVLSLCQYFSVVSGGAATWAQHVGGALALFRSSQRPDTQSPISRLLAQSLAINTAWKLISTAAVDPGSQMLLDMRSLQLQSSDPASSITQILLHIPFLQEDVRKLRERPASYAALSASLVERHEFLHNALDAWLLAQFGTTTPYTVVDSSSINSPERSVAQSKTFPNAYIFNDCLSAHLYCRYLLGQYLLARIADDATATDLDPRESQETAEMPKSRSQFKGQQSLIDAICRCMLFTCLPEHGYSGKASAITFLQIAQNIYSAMGRKDEHDWCNELLNSLMRKGLVVPSAHRKP